MPLPYCLDRSIDNHSQQYRYGLVHAVHDQGSCACVTAHAVPCILQSYVWHERDASAGVPWVRLVAALLLSTVTDALMRIGRAAAHLVLLLYRLPVKRKVRSCTGCKAKKDLYYRLCTRLVHS